ncbi:uncharacterized protein LOC132203679 isoform X2 [Neocloeon triangulifer]|uniref:uncharacterized protein LOC132203679 isoform X2 n=1 Tax=Neocloeon triangulifer TaxID=2078957 RepID=UPI00286F6B39|nr:uncharacterized protein LOC132203679 isoform X2 [Neocloeon triangulifer]
MDDQAIENIIVKKEPNTDESDLKSGGGDFGVSPRYICYFCGTKKNVTNGRNAYVFYTSRFNKLTDHVEKVHPNKDFRYYRTVSIKCFQCKISFSLKDFRMHMLVKHKGLYSALVPISICDSCHDHSNDHQQMIHHVVDVHQISRLVAEERIISMVICLLCGMRYKHGDPSMEQHLCRSLENLKMENELFPLINDGDRGIVLPLVGSELIDLETDDTKTSKEKEATESNKPTNSSSKDVLSKKSVSTNVLKPSSKTSLGKSLLEADTSSVHGDADEAGPPELNEPEEVETSKRTFSCFFENCDSVFNEESEMKEHLEEHLPKICHYCLTEFPGPNAELIHKYWYTDHKIGVDEETLQAAMIKVTLEVEDKESENEEEQIIIRKRRSTGTKKQTKTKKKPA